MEEKNRVLEILAIAIISFLLILIIIIIYTNKRMDNERQEFADKVNSISELAIQYYKNHNNGLVGHYELIDNKLINKNNNQFIHSDDFWQDLSGDIVIQLVDDKLQINIEITDQQWMATNKDNSNDLIITKN